MTNQVESIPQESPKRKLKREKTATESLLSIALAMESALMFFVGITAFGLQAIPAGIALGGGAIMIAVFFIASRLTRTGFGIGLGFALQALLILTGTVLPQMFGIGFGFAVLYTLCYIKGRSLDRQKLQHLQSEEES